MSEREVRRRDGCPGPSLTRSGPWAPDYESRGQESAGGSFKMCRWLPAADCDPIPAQVRLMSGLFSAVVRLLPAHDSLCAPFRRAQLGDEEVSPRTYPRGARASGGCYEVQAAFGQAPVGQYRFKLLARKILRRDEFRQFGYRKACEDRGQQRLHACSA